MEINTHGLKIDLDSLLRTANQTADWPANTGRTDIKYDPDTGEVWGTDHMDSPIESWSEYPGNIIGVTSTDKHHTAQWIADRIFEAMIGEVVE